MVDTRKFLMSKLAPRIYGDKQTIEHTGDVTHTVTMDDRERMRRLATFLATDAHSGVTIEGQAAPASPPALSTDDQTSHTSATDSHEDKI